MPRRLRLFLVALTCLGWLVAIADTLPWTTPYVTPELGLLSVATGAVGSLAMVVRRHARPAHELFDMGRSIGRFEVEQEYASERVARMDGADRKPRLRVVDDP